jgi:hypothetical protein
MKGWAKNDGKCSVSSTSHPVWTFDLDDSTGMLDSVAVNKVLLCFLLDTSSPDFILVPAASFHHGAV